MAVPTVATFSLAAHIGAHTFLRDLVDSGSGSGSIKLRSSTDVLLAQVPLSDPCGSVSGTTGQLTLAIAGPDTSADASGTAAYAEVCDSTGAVHLALPAMQQVGTTTAVSGYLVMNTLSIVSGGSVTVTSVTVG